MKHPVITPYKSLQELKALKDWFYNYDSVDNRSKAVLKVKGLLTKGKLPHGVESTSLLTSIELMNSSISDSNVLRLSYTMALIRFVNGLVDPFQQSNYILPMQLIAKQLNLPTYFVELRHMGTHENLPSLDFLKLAAVEALTWLKEYYWDQMTFETDIKSLDDACAFHNHQVEETVKLYEVYKNLKDFKKLRKTGNPNYEKNVKNLLEFCQFDSSLFFKILIQKYFILHSKEKVDEKNYKFSQLMKLYFPLIDSLGEKYQLQLLNYLLEIFDNLTAALNETTLDSKYSLPVMKEEDGEQILQWISYLLNNLGQKDIVLDLTMKLKASKEKCPRSLISGFNDIIINFINVSTSRLGKIEQLDELRESVKRHQTYELPPSLDEILADTSSIKRKNTKENLEPHKKQKVSYCLDTHDNWKPTPFGSCV